MRKKIGKIMTLPLSVRRFVFETSGGIAPFMALGLAGLMMAGAFAVDATRMSTSAAQLKRATDAAAMAVGQQKLADYRVPVNQLRRTAIEFVRQNLGMDSELSRYVDDAAITVTQGQSSSSGADTFEVSIDYLARQVLLGGESAPVSVSSTVEVYARPAEVSLILPNTLIETDGDLAALRRLGKRFARDLIGQDGGQSNGEIWLSLVPYSQAVNVYDAQDTNRLQRWIRPGALTPVELRSLFRSGNASSLADPRIPDRVANLLCMYRGMRVGQNYFWDQPPGGFGVYYREDLIENGSPGAPPISWIGPHPMFGRATGVDDVRWMVADVGCPHAPLLSLTDDLDKIDARLDMMSARFTANYAIAMGWAAASLSPSMRGNAGWGDSKLPLDFNPDDGVGNTKTIVMLLNTNSSWFDTDLYNWGGYNDVSIGGGEPQAGSVTDLLPTSARRFVELCNSFRARNIKAHFIVVSPDMSSSEDLEDFGRTQLGRVAMPGFRVCAQNGGSIKIAGTENFVQSESEIQSILEDVAGDIRSKSSFVRLVL